MEMKIDKVTVEKKIYEIEETVLWEQNADHFEDRITQQIKELKIALGLEKKNEKN